MRLLLLTIALAFPFKGASALQTGPAAPFLSLPAPSLRIGTDGDPNYQFDLIGSVERLPTGELAVADWRRPVIRIFTSTGRLTRAIGRDGEGPGEFRSVHKLFLAADTLIAYDWQLRRFTWFGLDGKVLGTLRISPAPEDGAVNVVDRLPDGRWLVTSPHNPNWNHGHGVYRDTLKVGLLAPTASGPVRWLDSVPGMTFYSHMPGQDRNRWSVGSLPFSANTIARLLDDRVLIGDNGLASLQAFSLAGLRLGVVPLPVPPATDLRRRRELERDRLIADAKMPLSREYAAAAFSAPREFPRYESFVPASRGQLWVQLVAETPDAPVRYLVLTSTGQIKARYQLPPRSRVLSVQNSEVFVVAEDADGVQTLAIYRHPSP